MKSASLALFVIALSLLMTGCFNSKSISHQSSDSLIVVPNAKNVRFDTSAKGREQMTYHVNVDYPANDVIAHISAQLAKRGWEPLKESFLNPGIRSSQVRGWQEYEDHVTKQHTVVHQWACDWKNKNDDIVMYYLQYRYVKGQTQDMTNLRVVGIFFTSALAKHVKDLTKQALPGK